MGFWNLFKKNKDTFRLYIKDQTLYYKDHESIEKVNLQDLKYAYAQRLLPDKMYLMLFDHRVHYINTDQNGFKSCYKILSNQYGFDDKEFVRIAKSKEESKARIYLRKESQNYQIIASPSLNVEDGLYVLNDNPHFISWDTSYTEFEKSSVGHTYMTDNGIRYFKFNSPVQIGNIILDNLEFYMEDANPNLPVQSYFIDLYHEDNTDQSYEDIKACWQTHSSADLNFSGYEREDQKHVAIQIQDIQFDITYNYGVENNYEQGCTFLYINNNRNYTDRILKDAPTLPSESISYLIFNTELNFMPDYKNSAEIVHRPNFIPKDKEFLFWYDEDNHRIGFTDEKYSIVFQLDEIDSIINQNVLPAKGNGYAILSVKPKNGYPKTIYYADQDFFNSYTSQIESLTKISVITPEPYYNC